MSGHRGPPAGPSKVRLDTSNPRFRPANSAARARSPPSGPLSGPGPSPWRPNGPPYSASAFERRPPSPPPRSSGLPPPPPPGPPSSSYYGGGPRDPLPPRSDGRWSSYMAPAGPPGPPAPYLRSPPSAGRKRMRDDFEPPPSAAVRDRLDRGPPPPPLVPRPGGGPSEPASALGAAPNSLPPVPQRQRQQLRPSLLPPRDEPNGAYAPRTHSRGPSYDAGPPPLPPPPPRDSYGRSYPALDSPPPNRSPTAGSFAPRPSPPPNGRLSLSASAAYPPRGPANEHGYAAGPRLAQSPHTAYPSPRAGPPPSRPPGPRSAVPQPTSPYERTWRPEAVAPPSAPLSDRDRDRDRPWERSDWSAPDKRRRTDTYDGRREREQSWSTGRGSDRAPSASALSDRSGRDEPDGLGIRQPRQPPTPSRIEREPNPPDQQPFDPGTRRPSSPRPSSPRPTASAPERERLASPFHEDENETPVEHLRAASGSFAAHREARAASAGSPHLNGRIASPPKSTSVQQQSPLVPAAAAAPPVVIANDPATTDEQSVAKALVRALDRIVTDGDASMDAGPAGDVSTGGADTTVDEGLDAPEEVEITWRDLLGEIMDGGNYGRSVAEMDPIPVRRVDLDKAPARVEQKLDIFDELESSAPALLEAHEVLRSYIQRDLEVRTVARLDRIDELRETYRTLNDGWQEHCTEMARGRERRERPVPAAMASTAGTSLLHHQPGAPSSSTRGQTSSMAPVAESPISMTGMGRSRRLTAGGGVAAGMAGDAVRSEAEFLAILASLESADMQDPSMRARRTAAVVPDQLDQHEAERYLATLDDTNGRIDDPEAFFGITARTPVDAAWTDDEVELFCRKYGTHPKAFGRIAQAIEGKTVQQCVRFYYDTKHIINYRKLVRHRGVVPGGAGSALPGLIRRKVGKSTSSSSKAAKALAAIQMDDLAADVMSSAAAAGPADRDELSPSTSLRGPVKLLLADDAIEDVKPHVVALPNGVHVADPAPIVGIGIDASAATTTKTRRKGTSYWGVTEKEAFARLHAEHGRDFERISQGLGTKTTAQCRNYLQRLEAQASVLREDSEASETPLSTPGVQAPRARTGPVYGFFDVAPALSSGEVAKRPSLLTNGANGGRRGSGMNIAAMLNDASDGEDTVGGRSSRGDSIRPVVRDWFEETDDETDTASNPPAPASYPRPPSTAPSEPAQHRYDARDQPRWGAYAPPPPPPRPAYGPPPPHSRPYVYSDAYGRPPPTSYPADLAHYSTRPPPPPPPPPPHDAFGRPPPNEAYAQRSPYPAWDYPPLSAAARPPPGYPAPAPAPAYGWHHPAHHQQHDRRPSWQQPPPPSAPASSYYGPARSAPPPLYHPAPPADRGAGGGGGGSATAYPMPGSAPAAYDRR